MNQSWLDQLSEIGADEQALTSTQANAPADSIQFLDRSDLAVVRFSGADVNTFLQAQTCNDHALLNPEKAQLNGYCSPKGRLLALPTVANDASAEEVFWLLPKEVVDSVVKRLTMFVLRSEVSIVVESDWVVMGLTIPTKKLAAPHEPWFGQQDSPALSSWVTHAHSVIKMHPALGQTRTLVFGTMANIKSSLESCRAAAPAKLRDIVWASSASWILGDIEAGVPMIVAGTQDAFVPQMVNMEAVEGLSFTKGCYPGQEIVARMQYLGKLKRTMVRFSGAQAVAVNAGDKIRAGDDENAGEVVAAASTHDGIELLAVIKTAADPDAFQLGDAKLCVQSLPYA